MIKSKIKLILTRHEQGAAFMALFGLGTIPAMLSISMMGHLINMKVRNRINKAIPLFMASMGLLLILRGLNLGIPYVSPEFSNCKAETHSCCKK